MNKSRTKYITVKLTEKEAEALLHALGNSTGFGDDMKAIFGDDKRRMKSCWDGEEKIKRALYKK
jgi:hypothetical protein